MSSRKDRVDQRATFVPDKKERKSKWDISHKAIAIAVDRYLINGGTITQLEPQNAYWDCGIVKAQSTIKKTVTRNLMPV